MNRKLFALTMIVVLILPAFAVVHTSNARLHLKKPTPASTLKLNNWVGTIIGQPSPLVL
jgi:hypothetical protein